MSPRGRLIFLVVCAGVPLVWNIWDPRWLTIGLTCNAGVILLALADRLLSPGPGQLDIERETSEVLSVGARNPVTLRVRNRARLAVRLELMDAPPEPSRTEGLPLRLRVPAGITREATYHLTPGRRGKSAFRALYLRYPSLFGLWTLQEKRPLETPARIYPDIKAVSRFELLARKNRLAEDGLKVWRLRGQGGEFDRLREYRREDEPRRIDWKATAKNQKLISRDYTVEQNQNVLFMLDCGRSMVNESAGISHLDRALNASVMLSYIALSQGDNVSLLAFSNRIERRVGPVRGKLAIRRVIHSVYDLEPSYDASDYSRAIEEVLRHQRKRALVVLVTHALDRQHLETIGEYVRTLRGRHLLLCVVLKDTGLAELATREPAHDLEAFRVAAAAELVNAQALGVRQLKDAGMMVIETLPADLTSVVINQYLEVKARHLL